MVDSLPDAFPTEEWRPRARRSMAKSAGFAWRKHLPLIVTAAVALPLASWTMLSDGTFGPSPVAYTDTTATNANQFYLIKSP